ncbi:MAG: alpha/beta hydrolase fold domain-containing protein [Gammaproteobacteria bacterium]|nr:alpha/beta hydrolase fold domain-containing protein [Gammaproteobacteria bacterium]
MKELGIVPVQSLSAEAARQQYIAMVNARPSEPAEVGSFEKRMLPGADGDVRTNIYKPAGHGETGLPLLVYFHGGGHVIGNPDTHDAVGRNLCAGAQCVVVSVDYRKGPEHKFPAAVQDAYAVTRWCAENAEKLAIDPAKIAVAGDSAGGNLAAVVSLMARDQGGPKLVLQVLVYPVADYNCSSPSYARYATGYGVLEAQTMLWFQRHYLNNPEEADHWMASPLKAASHANLPPALVMTAQYDVLHDEGVAYAEALKAAGNAVEHQEYAGMIHGFFTMTPIVDAAGVAQQAAVQALRRAFG